MKWGIFTWPLSLRSILSYITRSMYFLSYILGLVFLLTAPVHAGRHCKTERYRTYAEQIASLNPKIDLDLFDIKLFPDSSVVAGYEYNVEPAYTQGLYSRKDSWLISTEYLPEKDFDLSDGLNLNLSIGPKQKNEATFIRFFKDPCEAMLATPYSPRRIPLRARSALGEKFKKGDYFLFRGSVGFIVNAQILNLLGAAGWATGLSGSYLIEGFYQLHIVRLDETHVRLKVVAHRGRNFTSSFGVGYENEFDVFSIAALDNALEKVVNTKPLKVEVDHKKSNVFLVDYVLDLSDQKVANAFERVIRKVRDYRYMNLLRPFNLESSLLLDLTPLEELYQSDYSDGNVDRIRRNLRTDSDQRSYGIGVEAGNKIIGFDLEGRRSSAYMSIMQENNSWEKYLLRSWDRGWEGVFTPWARTEKREGVRALFQSNDEFTEFAAVNIVKYISEKRNRLSYQNFLDLKKRLKKALPPEIFNNIPWGSWGQTQGKKYLNFGLRFELTLSKNALETIPSLSEEEVRIFFRNYLSSQGLDVRDFFLDRRRNHGARALSSEERFSLSLKEMAKLLSQILDHKICVAQRAELITKLRQNKLFMESGLGFLISLTPSKLEDNYYLDLDISSNEAFIDFSFGNSSIVSLYKKILTIKAALDDEAFDLLREAESISLPEGY